ncbi:MAG: HAMP domain-containing protein, partial [Hyphomicrobiales bacterium]|nr:HAMP domain-containing protein [Hyphomicrobiales bacterium]
MGVRILKATKAVAYFKRWKANLAGVRSLKFKLLAGFMLASVSVIVSIGAVVTWKLNQSTREQSVLVADLVKVGAGSRVAGHQKILQLALDNVSTDVAEEVQKITAQRQVATLLQNSDDFELAKMLRTKRQTNVISFGMLFDAGGELVASSPRARSGLTLAQYFSGESAALPGVNDLQTKQTFSTITRLDETLVKELGLTGNGVDPSAGLATLSIARVRDEFGDPVGFAVLGKLLNGFARPLALLNVYTHSGYAIYVDGKPISSVGFGDNAPVLDKALETRIFGNGETNVALKTVGDSYIAACEPLRSGRGVDVAIACAAIPEIEVAVAQMEMTSVADKAKETVQFWVVLAGSIASVFAAVVGFILAGRMVGPLVKMTAVTSQLAGGDMQTEVAGKRRSDEIGDMARSLEQIRTVGVDATRAQAALEGASAKFMLVDTDNKIAALNSAALEMFRGLENQLRNDIADFAVDTLVGSSMDQFEVG